MTIGKKTIAIPVKIVRHKALNDQKNSRLGIEITALKVAQDETKAEITALTTAQKPIVSELDDTQKLKPDLDDRNLARIRSCVLTGVAPRLENNKAVFKEQGETGILKFYIDEDKYFQGKQYYKALFEVEGKMSANQEAIKLWQVKHDSLKTKASAKKKELSNVKQKLSALVDEEKKYGEFEHSAEDKATMKVEIVAWEVEKPMREWERKIADTDARLPRYAEDIIDVLTEERRAALSEYIISAYNDKKKLRSEKPK